MNMRYIGLTMMSVELYMRRCREFKGFGIKKTIKKFFKKRNNKSIYEEFLKLKKGESKEFEIDIYNSKNFYLGYLVYQGFEIVSAKTLANGKRKIKVKRLNDTLKPDIEYSWFIKLPRTGKNGKRINVYKFRTMQPYSEYLQIYMIRINGLKNDGTIKDDFRITKLGRFLRKYWLDELPMLINFIKGDLKVIGVRPLSDAMLSQYPQDFVPYRNKFKPGLIPPYYIDRPKSFDEIIESEKRYLKKYEQRGILTDIIYFLKFLDRVLFKGVRSS